MKTIIVLGGGYVSSKIQKYWKLKTYNLVIIRRKEIDYTIFNNIQKIIEQYNPEFIINCYGYTGVPNVDSCEIEKNKIECVKRNVIDWIDINDTFLKSGIKVINISSGCIYNDESGTKVFKESDSPNFGIGNPNSSWYSFCKALFQHDFERHYINNHYLLRIRMPFDADINDSKNYIGKILNYDFLINYKNSITNLEDLTRFIEIIIENNIETGIYNVVNKNPITAKEILETINPDLLSDKLFYTVDDLLEKNIIKCRRSNCILSTEKLEKYYNIPTSEERILELIK